jgi:hypothetical protein
MPTAASRPGSSAASWRRLASSSLTALAAAGSVVVLVGCRHAEDEWEPSFPTQVEQHCQTRPGCQQLFARLSAKREFCYREYGTGEDRPVDCDWNDVYWWALKDHIELTDLREHRAAPCPSAEPRQRITPARDVSRERQDLDREREAWRKEREQAVVAEDEWRKLEPKRCALGGEEEVCYQLVQYIALGANPHTEEAKTALAAGQRVIDERKKRGGK